MSGNAVFSALINGSENDPVQFFSANQQVGEDIVHFLNRTLPPSLAVAGVAGLLYDSFFGDRAAKAP